MSEDFTAGGQRRGTPSPAREAKSYLTAERLSEIKEQLNTYLSVLEGNTFAVEGWLAQNAQSVVLSYHSLMRAFAKKDMNAALSTLENLRESGVAGVMLTMPEIATRAEAAFGDDNAFFEAAAALHIGLPAHITQPLPPVPADELLEEAEPAFQGTPPAAPAPSAGKSGGWKSKVSGLKGWFKEKADALSAATDPNYERQQRRNLRNEILSVQSDRHYYVESFMDWVGEHLEPTLENPDAKALEKLQKTYMSPAYVLRHAEADYHAAVQGRLQALQETAEIYSALATMADKKDFTAFTEAARPLLFGQTLQDGAVFYRLLQADLCALHQADSLADLAFKITKKPEEQLALFGFALEMEPVLTLGGKSAANENDRAAILDGLLTRVLDKKVPLSAQALLMAQGKMSEQAQEGVTLDAWMAANDKNPFERIATRFAGDPVGEAQVAGAVLQCVNSALSPALLAQYLQIKVALRDKDSILFRQSLKAVQKDRSSLFIQALWSLATPSTPMVAGIAELDKAPSVMSSNLQDALSAGLLDAVRIKDNGQGAAAFKDLVTRHVMPALDGFSPATARRLMVHALAEGGMDVYRKALTERGGWLEQTVQAPLSETAKLLWLSVFLEPFRTGIVRANVLDEAASKAKSPDARNILRALERNMESDHPRLDDNRIICNTERMASVWHNYDTRNLRYLAGGPDHTLLDGVTDTYAAEVLSFMARRGNFAKEASGVFRPEKTDVVKTQAGETQALWHTTEAPLFAAPEVVEALHKNPLFLHEKPDDQGQRISTNLLGLVVVLPQDDGMQFIMDQFGAARMTGETLPFKAPPALLDLNGVWFNPQLAGVIKLYPEDKAFSLRIESQDFNNFLGEYLEGGNEWKISLSDTKSYDRLAKALRAAPSMVESPVERNTFYNMAVLEYLEKFSNDTASGFHCKKTGFSPDYGYIPASPDDADKILRALESKKNLVRAGDALLHMPSMDNAYYHVEERNLYFVLGHKAIRKTAEPDHAARTLGKIERDGGFVAVSRHPYHSKTKPDPLDLVNLKTAAMLSFTPALSRVDISGDSEQYQVEMNAAEAQALFTRIEETGRERAQKETAALAWTQKLPKIMAGLAGFSTLLMPAPESRTPADMAEYVLMPPPPHKIRITAEFNGIAAQDSFSQNDHLAPYTRVVYPADRPRFKNG